MTDSRPQRNAFADIIKGFLILCVIYGHSLTMVNGLRGVSWSDYPVNVFLTSFEIPFFLLISGYFLYYSIRNRGFNGTAVIKNRLNNMIPPLIIWEVLPFVVLSFINEKVSISGICVGLYNCIFSDKLWFISAYLLCSIIICVIQSIVNRIKSKSLSIAAEIFFTILVIIVCHLSRFSFGFTTYLIIFAIIGCFISKYSFLDWRASKFFIAFFAVVFFALYPFYSAEVSFYLYPQYILPFETHKLIAVLYRFFITISACCLILSILYILCRNKTVNHFFYITLGLLGKRSLGLYILSMFIQSLLISIVYYFFPSVVNYLSGVTVAFIWGPLFCAVLISLCLGIDKILSFFPKIHRLLLGF